MKFGSTAALGLSAFAMLSGCSSASDTSLVRWNASLRSVVQRSAVPPGADARCAPPLANQVGAREPLVAIVRLRVHGVLAA
jgi:hypothetical protein